MSKYLLLVLSFGVLHHVSAQSISAKTKKKPRTSFYFSWGYNAENYTRSNVHIKQDELGNDYTLNKVHAHENRGWSDGIFNKDLTIPQYNYRLGYMFNEDKGWGIEINFDHTKYIITEPQNIHLTGTLNNRTVDTTIFFDESNGFYYYLNNGANFFLINLVKKQKLFADKKERIRIDGLGKIGIGPVVPHVQNSFFGKENDPHFQLGGWNAGIEACVKATFFRYVYLEYSNKLDYARYSGLKIYKGKAKQAFGTYEMILSLGINIPGRKK